MTQSEQLKELITEEVLPELEEYIDNLFAEIAENKEATAADKEELQEVQTLRSDFQEMLTDIESGEIEEDEAINIVKNLL